ncbi:MAG: MerR family transcriptional regulator [Acidobacteriota bacterium]
MAGYTIGEMAAQVGVPTTTVRYYERQGLLREPRRTASNYRLYDEDEVDRLRFIRAAQSAGLTLSDIKILLGYRDGVVAPCREVQHLIEHRLASITENMRQMRHVKRVLESYLEICRQAEADGRCEVIDRLAAPGGAGPAHSRTRKRLRRS